MSGSPTGDETSSRRLPTRNRRTQQSAQLKPITFIDYTPGTVSGRSGAPALQKRRKDVRSHAAAASAEKRKATIARRDAERMLSRFIEYNGPTDARATPPVPSSAVSTPFAHTVRELARYLLQVEKDSFGYLKSTDHSSLVLHAIRTTLWEAMVNDVMLFQTATFLASTYTNTAGVTTSPVKGLPSGVIVLRGASLDAIREEIGRRGVESLTPVAIALLAGWERRFGDPEAFKVHMQAWQSLPLPHRTLEENHVTTLTSLTIEAYRMSLDERAECVQGRLRILPWTTSSSHLRSIHAHSPLPPGLKCIITAPAEARSLLDIQSRMHCIDIHSASAPAELRRLAIQNLAWSPHHTHTCEHDSLHDAQWDDAEVAALYHLRAAGVSVLGILLHASLTHLGVSWTFDVGNALLVHALTMRYLRTHLLRDTKFIEIGVWARFMLGAISRVPAQDEIIRSLVRDAGVASWEEMRALLRRHVYHEEVFGERCLAFWEVLGVGPSPDRNDRA